MPKASINSDKKVPKNQSSKINSELPKPLIKELWDFVKKPKSLYISKSPELGIKSLKDLFVLISWSVILGQLSYVIAVSVLSVFGVNLNDSYVLLEDLRDQDAWSVLLAVAMVGPLYEEVSYRLLLSKKVWEILVGFLLLILLLGFVSASILNIGPAFILFYILGFGLLGVSLVLLLKMSFNNVELKRFWRKYFGWIVWTSVSFFALAHITNFEGLGIGFIFTPLIVLPQFLLGITFSFARIKFSLNSSWFVHGIYNFITIWPLLVVLQASDQAQKYLDGKIGFDQLPSSDKVYLYFGSAILASIYFGVFYLVSTDLLIFRRYKV